MRAMSALFAFLHHLAAFMLVSALAIEHVLVRDALTLQSARRLKRTDAVFGAAAGVLLVVGLLRVAHFEKGAAYYFHNAFFIAKLSLFFIVGLVSILPTLEFISWRKALARGEVPVVAAERMKRLRLLIHAELAGVVLILFCAAFMAKGMGYFG
jgi:putative membrane protein